MGEDGFDRGTYQSNQNADLGRGDLVKESTETLPSAWQMEELLACRSHGTSLSRSDVGSFSRQNSNCSPAEWASSAEASGLARAPDIILARPCSSEYCVRLDKTSGGALGIDVDHTN